MVREVLHIRSKVIQRMTPNERRRLYREARKWAPDASIGEVNLVTEYIRFPDSRSWLQPRIADLWERKPFMKCLIGEGARFRRLVLKIDDDA